MRWNLIILWEIIIELLSSSLVIFTYGGQPSVLYITSPSGNFFVAENMTLSKEDAHLIMHTENKCQCRNQCFVKKTCKVWSTVPIDSTISECRMSSVGPMNYSLLQQENTALFFREETIDGEYFTMPDHLLYLKPNEELNFNDAKEYCSKIPGHRLSIYKKVKQWTDISRKMDNNEPYWVVDLEKQDDTTAIWGDGTLYSDTELGTNLALKNAYDIAKIYIFFNGTLDDGLVDSIRRFFCQANPLGVDW